MQLEDVTDTEQQDDTEIQVAPVDEQEASIEQTVAEPDDEDVVSFAGAEATPETESEGMRSLRERLKTVEREKKDLERKVAPPVQAIGPKPTLEDHGYDDDAYETALLKWHDDKRKADAAADDQRKAGEAAQQRWQEQERSFEAEWTGLRNDGKHAARAKVEDAFSPEQQAMLVKASLGKAAGLFFMLGSSKDSLDRLKALTGDPVEFVAAAAVMAKDIQVTKRKPATQPENLARGSGGSAGSSDAKLARLEAEARKTGNRTALNAYKMENGL